MGGSRHSHCSADIPITLAESQGGKCQIVDRLALVRPRAPNLVGSCFPCRVWCAFPPTLQQFTRVSPYLEDLLCVTGDADFPKATWLPEENLGVSTWELCLQNIRSCPLHHTPPSRKYLATPQPRDSVAGMHPDTYSRKQLTLEVKKLLYGGKIDTKVWCPVQRHSAHSNFCAPISRTFHLLRPQTVQSFSSNVPGTHPHTPGTYQSTFCFYEFGYSRDLREGNDAFVFFWLLTVLGVMPSRLVHRVAGVRISFCKTAECFVGDMQ